MRFGVLYADKNERKSIVEKLKKNYTLIASPFIVMAVLLAAFYKGGLYPFGNGSAAWCDMYQQVIPLLTDLKDVLSGKQSLFFNLNNAGGMNFLGVFFFFIASPFSLLVAFVDKTEIVHLVDILIVLKLGLSGFTASLYLKKHFDKLSQMLITVLAVSYGLCGYGMLYFQNNIWLDEMYLFPLLMLSFDLLVQKRKIIPFIITLAATVIVNYYISYMVIIFVLLIMGLFCYRNKNEEKYRYAGFDLIISCMFAALASAVVWIPCFTQYLSSGRTTSLVHELASCNFLGSYQTTLSTLLPTSALILIVIVCALDAKPRNKEQNTALILLFLTFVPLIIEPINKMWHTGSYMSFPSRYGFITVFMLVICAAGFLTYDSKSIAPQKNKTDSPLYFVVGAVVIYCYYMFFTGFVGNNYEKISVFTRTLWQNNDSFVMLFELFVVSALLESVVFFMFKKGRLSRSVFAIFICACVVIEGFTNADIYMLSANSRDPERAARQQAVVDLADRIDDNESFYRVNTSRKLFDVNLVGAMGYNSLGHYTSLTDEDYMFMMKQMGYSSYWMEVGPYGGTELTDALMNVKYRIVKKEVADSEPVFTNETYSIVRNDWYLPLGAVTSADLSGSLLEPNTRAFDQQMIFEMLFNTDEKLITEYNYIHRNKIVDPPSPVNAYAFKREENTEETYFDYVITVKGSQTLYFDCFNDLSNALTEPINDSCKIVVNGATKVQNYPTKDNNGLQNLGEFKDETVTVKVILKKDIDVRSFGIFGLDTELLSEKLAGLSTVNIKEDGSKLKGSIEASDGQKCILSVPCNDGLTVKINGKAVDTQHVFSDLISFELKDGNNDIEISFKPKGFMLGLIVSLIGIAMTVFYAVKIKKYEPAKELTTIMNALLMLATLAAIAAVYVLPCLINMYIDD